MDNRELISRLTTLQSNRSSIESVWDLVERFIAPFSISLFDKQTSGLKTDWSKREIYDGTAIRANVRLSSNLHSAMTNIATKWNTIAVENSLNQKDDVKRWLSTEDQHNFETIQNSNFSAESAKSFLQLTSYGEAFISSMPVGIGNNMVVNYASYPVGECYADYDHEGIMIRFFRTLSWTLDQIVARFGVDSIPQWPEVIRTAYNAEKRNLEKRYDIIFCIDRRPEIPLKEHYTITAPSLRPFVGKYILRDTAETFGEDIYFHEMPVFAPLWQDVPGTSHGFSPAMMAVWDTLTLNQLAKLILLSAEKVLDPTMLVQRKGVLTDIDLSSGGVIVVRDIDKSMRPFESGARFDVSAMNKQDLIRAIEDTFYTNELQLKDSPAMTATEVHARLQLLQRLLGPNHDSINIQFLEPAVRRHFKLNMRHGVLTRPNFSIEDSKIRIEFMGALVRAQKSGRVLDLNRYLGTIGALAEAFPEVRDIPDVDRIVKYMANLEDVPLDLLRSDMQVSQIRQERADLQTQQMQAEMAMKQASAVDSAGKGVLSLKNAGVM